MKNKLQSMSYSELQDERMRYITNDCDGHDVNERLSYLNEISNLLDAANDAAAREVLARLPK